METYKDIYKFPLKQWDSFSRVDDAKGNFVFQFEPRFNNGDYQDGWKDFEKKALAVINGEDNFKETKFHSEEGQIFVDGDTVPIITIRGWGNLTGIGAHNLPADEAANIQDTFTEFIVERLNATV